MKMRTRSIVLCTMAICLVSIYALLPEVLSVAWHLRHGNSIQFGGWEIPVPWRYLVIKGKDAIVLQRPLRWSPTDDPAVDLVIRNLDLPVGKVFDNEKWKRAIIDDSNNGGDQYISDKTLELDNEFGMCITFSQREHPESLLIHCIFPIHRLDIQYMGPKSHYMGLDATVKGIRSAK